MISRNDEVRDMLATFDLAGLKRLYAIEHPNEPVPEMEALAMMMHMARTQLRGLPDRARIFSHRWLMERRMPSFLPDRLKAKAEQVEQKIVGAVGLSVNFRAPELKPVGQRIEKVMAAAVADAYANGDTDPDLVRKLASEAGQRERKRLLGR